MNQLQRQQIAHQRSPKLGTMVELPSLLETAEEVAEEVEFFSIGSNDFVQYMLAADRGNDNVAEFYCAHHPSVLRGMARFVRAARSQNRPVTVCGEMAHELAYVPFLLGIGIRNLSIAPHRIGELQEFISSIDISSASEEAELLQRESTIAGVEELLRSRGRQLPNTAAASRSSS